MSKVARIPSKIYYQLFEIAEKNSLDPDKVLGCYAIIKTSRKKEKFLSYTAKNNKFVGGYSLLRKKTNISLNTLKKYVPSIVEAGLIRFEKNGDIRIIGNNKLKTENKNYKLVPIQILGNLSRTAKSSLNVRLHSSARQQKYLISKKSHQRELIMQASNPRSQKRLKKAQALIKKHGEKGIEVIDKVVLSNQGYCMLKFGESDNKSKGHYWKTTMKNLGFIETKRRFKKIKKMSFGEYKVFKQHCDELTRNRFTYFRGHLSEELISEMKPQEKAFSKEDKKPVKNPFHPNDPLHTWVKEDLNKYNYKRKWEESKKHKSAPSSSSITPISSITTIDSIHNLPY